MQFTLTIEHKHDIIEELRLRAWQERAVATIGRRTKASRDAHEHAAVALENLAHDIGKWEVRETPSQESRGPIWAEGV